MEAWKKVDQRDAKEILKSEIFLTAPMIRKILNCSYKKSREIINKGQSIEKEHQLYVDEYQRQKQIRTTTFKEMINLWKQKKEKPSRKDFSR